MLQEENDYEVHMADKVFDTDDASRLLKAFPSLKTTAIDVTDKDRMLNYIRDNEISTVISSLPYFVNVAVCEIAREAGIHYFDLTEDTKVTKAVKELSEGCDSSFVPQCGLAPGFISIAANSIMKEFDSVDEAKLRVGALPQHTSNALHYALTWSTDGVINEYGNPCHSIEDGKEVSVLPLEGLEHIQIDGLSYEAFNTSGGLGSLAELHQGRVKSLNYKTMRYPGHCEKMKVLMNDLKLNHDRDTLKVILERAIPKTYQDVVIIYVSVTGQKDGVLLEKNFVKKVYPKEIAGLCWSAIQVTTASGICTAVDLVLREGKGNRGLVLQENFSLQDFLANRFGRYYA
jgi:saccharopine dehydrogenase-like NADP-dependent oxidoreductase